MPLAPGGKVGAVSRVVTSVPTIDPASDDTLDRYLARLRVSAPRTVDPDTLRTLQRAHLEQVAFENLDIHLDRPIRLDAEHVLSKVVSSGRGGFCYELNSAFAWLLRRLGASVDLLQAQVFRPDGAPGPAFDHLALRVTIGDERFLADVGFGICFVHPLHLDATGPQEDPAGTFELVPTAVDGAGGWDLAHDGSPAYRLDGRPRAIDEFGPMCTYHQTSPESPFTQGTVCTRLTPDGGRVTIADATLTVTSPTGERTREHLDRAALEAAYAEHFGYPPALVRG